MYIKSREGAAKDVLKDLVEMTRGVQHPVRGLFLRTYLSQVSKSLLPDTGSEYEGDGGNVQDAVEFVLQNFTEVRPPRLQTALTPAPSINRLYIRLHAHSLRRRTPRARQMNKLWVRMQHQGPTRDKEKREKERLELRDLVGKNLLVLSQLEGVDVELYTSAVLPRILEQVVNCKDELAQPYLLDAVIQVFPDEFHLRTLETLLAVCPQLQPNVKVGGVLAGLMSRLAKYAADVPEVAAQFHELGAFAKFSDVLTKVTAAQPDMGTTDIVAMYSSLMAFAIQIHKEQLSFVDLVLAGCASAIEGRGKVGEAKAVKQLVALLTAPLEAYDVVPVLSLSAYPRVMGVLEHKTRKQVAVTIVRSILKSGTLVSEVEQVDLLFQFISLLVADEEGAPPPEEEPDQEDWEEEQNLVARLVHHIGSPEPGAQYRMLLAVRRHFGAGGPRRLPHTLPPLVFCGLQLVRTLRAQTAGTDGMEQALKKLFQFLHQTVQALAEIPAPEAALRLYLHCAQAASDAGLEPIAYEFCERAFELFEESIPESKAQVVALQLIAGTLHRCSAFGAESREALVHKATSYSAKLLKKPDQCRAVATCSHLFWHDGAPDLCDGASVLSCLKRALKIANAAQQAASAKGEVSSVALFVEILNKFLYFYDKGCDAIEPAAIQSLLDTISAEVAATPACLQGVEGSHASTLALVRARQAAAETASRFAEFKL